MGNLKKFLVGFVIAWFMVAFAGGAMAEEHGAKVKEAMQMLKEKLAAYGTPRVEGMNLFFGDRKINEDYEAVDAVKEALDTSATVFVKHDPKFIRISTNVMREGKRAIGTELDPHGPVYPLISQGQSYYGKADILGTPYETGYEPIVDEKNQVIGIYFVGLSLKK
jgi:hypothetical protein